MRTHPAAGKVQDIAVLQERTDTAEVSAGGDDQARQAS
jgi:hypothetical protein